MSNSVDQDVYAVHILFVRVNRVGGESAMSHTAQCIVGRL